LLVFAFARPVQPSVNEPALRSLANMAANQGLAEAIVRQQRRRIGGDIVARATELFQDEAAAVDVSWSHIVAGS
jgi:hypothetical protein